MCHEQPRAATAAAAGARLVNVGDAAGGVIAIPSALLRSRRLEVSGHSNLTVRAGEQTAALIGLLGHVAGGRLEVPHEVWPAEELALAWTSQAGSPHRKVLVRLP